VAAAEDLRRWVDTANRRWQQRYGVEVALAVGIASGPVVAGNLVQREAEGVYCDRAAGNVAARLETMAQPRQIFVAESTRADLSDVALRPIGERALLARDRTTLISELAE